MLKKMILSLAVLLSLTTMSFAQYYTGGGSGNSNAPGWTEYSDFYSKYLTETKPWSATVFEELEDSLDAEKAWEVETKRMEIFDYYNTTLGLFATVDIVGEPTDDFSSQSSQHQAFVTRSGTFQATYRITVDSNGNYPAQVPVGADPYSLSMSLRVASVNYYTHNDFQDLTTFSQAQKDMLMSMLEPSIVMDYDVNHKAQDEIDHDHGIETLSYPFISINHVLPATLEIDWDYAMANRTPAAGGGWNYPFRYVVWYRDCTWEDIIP